MKPAIRSAWLMVWLIGIVMVGLMMAGPLNDLQTGAIVVLYVTLLAAGTLWAVQIAQASEPKRFRFAHTNAFPRKCAQCGYDLRASKERCPECGTPIPPPDIPLTPAAKRVIAHAAVAAGECRSDYIGTEHLLLALLQEPQCVAAAVLNHWEITELEVRDAIIALTQPEFAAFAAAAATGPGESA